MVGVSRGKGCLRCTVWVAWWEYGEVGRDSGESGGSKVGFWAISKSKLKRDLIEFLECGKEVNTEGMVILVGVLRG